MAFSKVLDKSEQSSVSLKGSESSSFAKLSAYTDKYRNNYDSDYPHNAEFNFYKVGEGFDRIGLNAVNYGNGKTTNVNGKSTFYTSKTVELTQGRLFTTTGTKVVEIRYNGKKVDTYTITVTK